MNIDSIMEIIDKSSELYPRQLKEIRKPPKKLYCAGDLSLLNRKSIGVVGSRKHTMYGKIVATMIGKEIANANIPVVSGMAIGIDSFAHKGCLEAGGNPIAVLGTGLDVIYPSRNKSLYYDILKNGLIISEYPLGTKGAKYTFPERNRIISGLSESLVVVEAGLKSGSLLTAELANEQGRTVFAVPGNINSQFSFGTNQLIRDGAFPLVCMQDLFNDITIDNNQIEIPNDIIKNDLNKIELLIYEEIEKNEGCYIDNVAHTLNINTGKVGAILTLLEIKGLIQICGGKLFLAK